MVGNFSRRFSKVWKERGCHGAGFVDRDKLVYGEICEIGAVFDLVSHLFTRISIKAVGGGGLSEFRITSDSQCLSSYY